MQLALKQLQDRQSFIDNYINATNAASGSEVDSNANVTHKTLATLEAELYKPLTIQINRRMVCAKLRERFGGDIANSYIRDIKNHLIYAHDETSLKPYCASISLYPFLLDGTKSLGGVSGPPKNLQSFCGGFVNLVYQIASNFAGAVATVEFLHMFDYFARKTYGKDYLETHEKEIEQELHDLNFSDAKFEIKISPASAITATGRDNVEIFISTNKGEPLKPLIKVASGGEISRIMLAIKNITGNTDNIHTLIFDEIDAGISGKTASIIGKKLKKISQKHQIICITHLPQIAAAGDNNYRIYKKSDDNSTHTFVEELEEDAAVREIARLIGGETITATTLAGAKELMLDTQNR